MKLFLALLAVTMVGYVASECTTKAAVNGPFTTYMGTSTVESADECAAKCTATPGCTLFKFCNSDDACKNYWSRGGPDSPKNSCLLGSGDFSAREPNDWSIGGFTASARRVRPGTPQSAVSLLEARPYDLRWGPFST
eukprot:jgi/Botrbrau1/1733/Bobra.116_2s0074.2